MGATAVLEMTTVQFNLGGTLKFLVEPSPRCGAIITLSYDGFSITAWGDGMSYNLPSGRAVKCHVQYVDGNGHPATVDGEVRWDSSNSDIATIQVDVDDTSYAVIAAAAAIGQVQITATADADLGEGVRPLLTIMDVEVVAGEAVAGTISPVGESTPIEPTQHR